VPNRDFHPQKVRERADSCEQLQSEASIRFLSKPYPARPGPLATAQLPAELADWERRRTQCQKLLTQPSRRHTGEKASMGKVSTRGAVFASYCSWEKSIAATHRKSPKRRTRARGHQRGRSAALAHPRSAAAGGYASSDPRHGRQAANGGQQRRASRAALLGAPRPPKPTEFRAPLKAADAVRLRTAAAAHCVHPEEAGWDRANGSASEGGAAPPPRVTGGICSGGLARKRPVTIASFALETTEEPVSSCDR